MKRCGASVCLSVAIVFLSSAGARAQSASSDSDTLAKLLGQYLLSAVTMISTVGTVAGNPHEAHYLPTLSQKLAPYELNKALVTQLATFPTGSSSAGFTFTRDATGAVIPTTASFGPSFAERHLTIGAGQANFGFNFQHVKFDAFEDVDLDSGELTFLLPHNNCCPGGANNPVAASNLLPFFEGDLVQVPLSLDVETDTFSGFVNYGVTDRLDVGVVVPFVRVDVRAFGSAEVLRLSTSDVPGDFQGRDSANIHVFNATGGRLSDLRERAGSQSGIGDVLLRAKYNFWKGQAGGLAAGLDLRLPTGDEDNLLGTGATQTRLTFIASGGAGRIFPHVNLGYTFSSGEMSQDILAFEVPDSILTSTGQPSNPTVEALRDAIEPPPVELSVPDEFNYTFGLDVSVAPAVTLAFDAVGRTLRDVNRFDITDTTFQFFHRTDIGADGQPTRLPRTASLPEFKLRDEVNLNTESVNLVLGVISGKVNLGGTFLLTASVLFPMTQAGLRPKVTPVVGFDYSF